MKILCTVFGHAPVSSTINWTQLILAAEEAGEDVTVHSSCTKTRCKRCGVELANPQSANAVEPQPAETPEESAKA